MTSLKVPSSNGVPCGPKMIQFHERRLISLGAPLTPVGGSSWKEDTNNRYIDLIAMNITQTVFFSNFKAIKVTTAEGKRKNYAKYFMQQPIAWLLDWLKHWMEFRNPIEWIINSISQLEVPWIFPKKKFYEYIATKERFWLISKPHTFRKIGIHVGRLDVHTVSAKSSIDCLIALNWAQMTDFFVSSLTLSKLFFPQKTGNWQKT